MGIRTANRIQAEIEALQVRIRQLRLERKMAVLAETERKLLAIANGEVVPQHPDEQGTAK